ncbi:LPS export ABC transporter permease LptF [Desulfosarcina ovata subsp. sediminis]|uniref:LPS export ABC transporter permease LptF n=1 Tax=Desulfosarcina ovata subsp. sediminis TaxID=885957 RepID=A0A5K7ZI95_9BACT|nr:LPS export ABC transporter permease LptF [Desulfosarcina ovata]BBO80591.1 LPS export ABC transporter permease LptF [Desulfosarcina ovata subsp. sediminis]
MINPFSILFRYLFLEMLPPFFINMAFFSFIFLMKQILDITDMIVNHNVGIGPVCLMLIYTMPYFLQYVIPMSVMMAVLLALLRMSSDNEIMALKAGGVSIYRLLPPVLAFSLVGTLLTGCMTIAGVPMGAHRFKTLLFEVATANLNVSLKERTFNDSFKDVMIYVNRIDPQSGHLQQVLIEDSRTGGATNTVVARTGELFGEPEKMLYQLRLFDGMISQVDPVKQSSYTIHFKTYDIRLDLKGAMSAVNISKKRIDEMMLKELRAYLQCQQKKGSGYRRALIKYHRKFSIPLACLAMGLLAVPLGIQNRHSKKSFGIGLGLFFFLFYYILLSVGTTMGENGYYPPVVGMWMPNAVLGGFAIFLLSRATREKSVDFFWFGTLISGVVRRLAKQ